MTPCFVCQLYTERYGQAPDVCTHPEPDLDDQPWFQQAVAEHGPVDWTDTSQFTDGGENFSPEDIERLKLRLAASVNDKIAAEMTKEPE